MICMSYVCYLKLKNPLSLKTVAGTAVHSTTWHDLCPVGLTCEITIGMSQCEHTFIVHKKLQKELIGHLQQLHHIGCNWKFNRQIILLQCANVLIVQ